MINKNKIFRNITLGLQIIAIAAYFIPALVVGDRIAIIWLVIGVLHTVLFCAIFFRDSRRRLVLSVISLAIIIIWLLILIIFGWLLSITGMGIDVTALYIYAFGSLFAAIFALANPRKHSVDGCKS